jgi:hypothetical protein
LLGKTKFRGNQLPQRNYFLDSDAAKNFFIIFADYHGEYKPQLNQTKHKKQSSGRLLDARKLTIKILVKMSLQQAFCCKRIW